MPNVLISHRGSYTVEAEQLEEWVRRAAERPKIPVEEVHRRYEALAERFPLKLAWRPDTT